MDRNSESSSEARRGMLVAPLDGLDLCGHCYDIISIVGQGGQDKSSALSLILDEEMRTFVKYQDGRMLPDRLTFDDINSEQSTDLEVAAIFLRRSVLFLDWI